MGDPEGEVTIKIDGREYTGHWRDDDKGMIRVSYGGYSSKPTRLGGHAQTPIVLARILLREWVMQALKEGAV
jgi:hypothetical protein